LLKRILSHLDGSNLVRKYVGEFLAEHPDCNCCLVDAGAIGDLHHRWKYGLHLFPSIRFDPAFREPSTDGLEQKLPFALASSNGVINIKLAKKPETSSKFAPNLKFVGRFESPDRFRTVDEISVRAVTLEPYVKNKSWFAKLDVQGMELEILESAASNLNGCVGAEVELEFSEVYLGQPLAPQILEFMNSAGFEFVDFLGLNRWSNSGIPGPGQLVFGDALFLRSPEWVSASEDECLRRLYVAVCLNYGRVDLVTRLVALCPDQDNDQLRKIIEQQARRFRLQSRLANLLQVAMRPLISGSTVYVVK